MILAECNKEAADTLRDRNSVNSVDSKKGLEHISEEELSETEIPARTGTLTEVMLKKENPSKKYKIEKKLNSV